MVYNSKLNAARKAIEYIEDGLVVGIGSGTTVEIFIKELGKKIVNENIEITGVASSLKSHMLAVESGIAVSDLIQFPEPDIYVDGADQIDLQFNCIKGGGAALTREKIVAHASKKFVVIVDSSKIVEKLHMPVPVEIIPFAYGYVEKKIRQCGGRITLREGGGKFGPVVSDNGNLIADCDFGVLNEPEELEKTINFIPGVLENGIFSKEIVDSVIAGEEGGVKVLK
jgi:ribose 5-phosphate isomerase A